MSILKLKAQNFNEIDTPRCDTSGSWYVLGYDNSQGGDPMLAQMDCNRNIVYITGGTQLSTTSGTSGGNGTSGISIGGTSGTSGKNGTSGNNGNQGNTGSGGTSGSSGMDGTFLGTNGTSGSSGKDGTFLGSSGTSGNQGNDGSSGTSGCGSSGTSGGGSSGTSGGIGAGGTSGSSGTSGNDGLSDINSFTWVISDPETGGIPGPKIWSNAAGFYGYDGLRIDSYISGGTDLTFNIQDRNTDELLVSGTTVYSGTTTSLTLTGGVMDFFRGLNILPDNLVTLNQDSWLWLEITNVNGSPGKLIITIFVIPYINL